MTGAVVEREISDVTVPEDKIAEWEDEWDDIAEHIDEDSVDEYVERRCIRWAEKQLTQYQREGDVHYVVSYGEVTRNEGEN